MKINTLKLDGIQFQYSISRKNFLAAPVLFINGAFQNMYSWKPVQEILYRHRTTILVDLPGWGDADSLPSDVPMDFYSDAIEFILMKENIKKIIIVSTSYGTAIATTFARHHCEKVERLILTAPLIAFTPQMRLQFPRMVSCIKKKKQDQLLEFFYEVGLLNLKAGEKGLIHHFQHIKSCFEKQIGRLNDKKLTDFLNHTVRILKYGNDNLNSISSLNVLVVSGQFDLFTNPTVCLQIAKKFDQSNFKIIPNADHFLIYERPAFLANLILEFIKKPIVGQSNPLLNRA